MKRFWLFSHAAYYPGGVASDFRSMHDTLDEAMHAREILPEQDRGGDTEYAQIVDTQTGSVRKYMRGTFQEEVVLE